jgi:Trypsin-like peptidase domain
MQDLNKHQIVLLCILISFVISIATGIMTTSLLMQAPVELTRTVNNVIERTIETVTPTTLTTSGTKKIETVVVNEDDSITSSIAKNTPSVVRIRERSADGTVDDLYGLGFIISKEGIIVSDKKYISSVMTYVAITSDGKELTLVPVSGDKKWQLGFFKAKVPNGISYNFVPASLDTSDLKLGQTVIVIGGDTINSVSVGRVVTLNTRNISESTTTPVKAISSIEASVSPSDEVNGAPLISLSGNIVGVTISSFSSPKSYLPSSIIKQELDQITIVK